VGVIWLRIDLSQSSQALGLGDRQSWYWVRLDGGSQNYLHEYNCIPFVGNSMSNIHIIHI
jgi:hypothetical protein